MTHRASKLVLLGLVSTLLVPSAQVWCQDPGSNNAEITAEILARYRSFEGSPDQQTWDLWKDYFLRSPEIANMHGTQIELGWEAYRQGSVEYYRKPPSQRAAVRFEELEVHVIDSKTAWVRGVFVNVIGERELRPLFYDMLTKTEEGWRVFFSYVAPPG